MFQIGNFVIVGSLPSLSVFTKYVNMFQYLLIQWQKEISGFISLSQPKMDSIHTCAKLRIKFHLCNNTAMIIYMGLIYITLTFIIFEFQFSTVSVMGHSFKIPMLALLNSLLKHSRVKYLNQMLWPLSNLSALCNLAYVTVNLGYNLNSEYSILHRQKKKKNHPVSDITLYSQNIFLSS